ncbi:MAG TPA: rhomboid family intramembrane serine protease [Egibacteraceae bacterium]|nr:rhomboid family intramembrane serine protease [Actinomycetota bacterium]HWB72099.1 rhomboid family intramembrane serine protease [Egibacteraceae bacterium]
MVIPVGDRNPTRRTPWVNWLLVALNVGVFVFLEPWWADTCTQQRFFLQWAAVPAEIVQGSPLEAGQVQATTPPACAIGPMAGKDVYAAIVYSMFLHAGWVHLLGNMLYLWIFGNNVEDRYGHLGYLGFYLASGAAATVAFTLPNLQSTTTLVGASGAIAGVLGAYLVLFPAAQVTVLVPFLFFLPLELPALVVLGLWFLLQLDAVRPDSMSGGGVAYLAHVAGFVAGLGATLLVLGLRSSHSRRGPPPTGWP